MNRYFLTSLGGSKGGLPPLVEGILVGTEPAASQSEVVPEAWP